MNLGKQLNHLPYSIVLNDVCDIENNSMSSGLNLVFCLALVLQGTKFTEDTLNISSDIEQKPYISCGVALNDLCDLENKIKVTWYELALVLL